MLIKCSNTELHPQPRFSTLKLTEEADKQPLEVVLLQLDEQLINILTWSKMKVKNRLCSQVHREIPLSRGCPFIKGPDLTQAKRNLKPKE